jgi:phage terminase large subunit-like protein
MKAGDSHEMVWTMTELMLGKKSAEPRIRRL